MRCLLRNRDSDIVSITTYTEVAVLSDLTTAYFSAAHDLCAERPTEPGAVK